MKFPYAEPDPGGSKRAVKSKEFRDLATEVSRLRPQALTRSNEEEADYGGQYPTNFTKGLLHDDCGILAHEEDYQCYVEAINSPIPTLFEKHVQSAESRGVQFHCSAKITCNGTEDVSWRGWESPRAGHVYDLEGPDAGAVGMAPAPRVGSSELAAEMAEVYALAILRDVPFTVICVGGGERLCGTSQKPGQSVLPASTIVSLLNDMPFFSGKLVTSSSPDHVDCSGLNRFERNRRFARTLSLDGELTTQTAFRGSTVGAQVGPYISQFMLVGARSLAGAGSGTSDYPGLEAAFDLQDGYIPYGSLIIDQRTLSHKNGVDYMTDWCSWLDVQNGANVKGADQYESKRRFITTPRDLATYVHFDALYEAYLNACLIMLALKVPTSKGFPEPSPSKHRDAFATFGGPHILSLVTEVATRCLKAVRRQKFNYHRRARPETIGGRFTLACLGLSDKLGCAGDAFNKSLEEIPYELRDAIIKHNAAQNELAGERNLDCNECTCLPDKVTSEDFAKANLLLPMAFPEGSPMHPAYGAGHATVAGGCVTMLKSFFEMFQDCDSSRERELLDHDQKPLVYIPNTDGSQLIADTKCTEALTIQGELNKLAANISIGRNMAGVHYYSDYYDSLRMGERVAVGILLELAPSYGEAIQTTFNSFDGDLIMISGEPGSAPSLSIMDRNGTPVSPRDWWLRHVSGEEFRQDL
jgi:hypothetical protein